MLTTLADREIKRVRNWSAQAITYTLDAVNFRQLGEAEQKRLDDRFDIRLFQHQVLKYGPLPLTLLDQILKSDD